MTQEIVTIDSEANVRISRKAIHSVEGKFTKSNLGTINTDIKLLTTEVAADITLVFLFLVSLLLVQWAVHSLLAEPCRSAVDG